VTHSKSIKFFVDMLYSPLVTQKQLAHHDTVIFMSD